jgi:hypothetical protein
MLDGFLLVQAVKLKIMIAIKPFFEKLIIILFVMD